MESILKTIGLDLAKDSFHVFCADAEGNGVTKGARGERSPRGDPGVGVLSASYLAASLGDGSAYCNGRQFAASLGLVPCQNSTGGKQKLGSITTVQTVRREDRQFWIPIS